MQILSPPLQELQDELFLKNDVTVRMLRLDLIHPYINGNKYFKMKYNIAEAQKERKDTLLTFGGAFSNHIYATAAAGRTYGLKTIGIIRGDELTAESNEVLRFARDNGMRLKFVTRDWYRRKHEGEFIRQLQDEFGDFYLLPEGGSNQLAVKGASEIPGLIDAQFTHVVLAAGTAGTAAGISLGLKDHQKVIAIAVVNAEKYFDAQVKRLLKTDLLPSNLEFDHRFHAGAYANTNVQLDSFRSYFSGKHKIKLDKIYNTKSCFGLYSLIAEGVFARGSSIVVVNTGGYIN